MGVGRGFCGGSLRYVDGVSMLGQRMQGPRNFIGMLVMTEGGVMFLCWQLIDCPRCV